jgi:hypothetical protein
MNGSDADIRNLRNGITSLTCMQSTSQVLLDSGTPKGSLFDGPNDNDKGVWFTTYSSI